MKPGYYMFKPMGYPIEVGNGALRDMSGAKIETDIRPDDLKPAALVDLLRWGGDFDDKKIVTSHVAWAEREDAEEWRFACDEDDAIGQAQDEDLSEIWIDDSPRPADPREVIPPGESILETMLDNSYDDVSTFWAAREMGWLDAVTPEQSRDLDEALKRVICDWLLGHGHWPHGFICGGHSRRVEVPAES